VVNAGDEVYHAVVTNAIENTTMATGNLLYDLKEVRYINLTDSWWDIELNKDLSLLNRQFSAANAINLMSYEATWIGMFNKKLMQDNGYSPASVYEMVKAGTWTLENYMELTKNFIQDLNNDGKMDHEDQYGTSGQGTMALGFIIGAGLRFVEKEKDDYLVFTDFNERTSRLLELVTEFCNTNVAFNSHNAMNGSGNGEYSRVLLAENRALFFTETLLCVRVLRDMADDFGVVPMPKLDESQEKYTSMVHHWATSLTSVPITCPDIEMAGIIIEEMAFQSKKAVVPVYFETAINGKYLRDEESIEMIDYIMENRVIDYAIVSDLGGLTGRIEGSIFNNRGDFASIYESAGDSMTTRIERMIESIQ
jgi:hypothetical protein